MSESGEGIDYRIYQEESELKIRLPLSANRNAAGDVGMKQLTVAIPPSYEFEQIELEHVAGSFYAERLFARELSVEVVSGTMDIGGGRVKELELECISGSCQPQNTVSRQKISLVILRSVFREQRMILIMRSRREAEASMSMVRNSGYSRTAGRRTSGITTRAGRQSLAVQAEPLL